MADYGIQDPRVHPTTRQRKGGQERNRHSGQRSDNEQIDNDGGGDKKKLPSTIANMANKEQWRGESGGSERETSAAPE